MDTECQTVVRVTAKHIRNGIAGDCMKCAVSLAMDDATDDKECMVVEIDWILHLKVWSRYIVAPERVRHFVRRYDGLNRKEGGCPVLPRKLTASEVAPFEFSLPPFSSPRWREECYRCEKLCDPKELDDEAYCPECRGEDEDES